ncbi:MAG: hypothetical protein ABIC18_02770 [Candidatus Omnitrophota bacterium]
MKGILLLGLLCIFCGYVEPYEQGLVWENVSGEIMQVNAFLLDRQDSDIIFLGTNRGVFKTQDGGGTWQAVLSGINKKVNSLYIDKISPDSIYALCVSGLFFSSNQGNTWQKIFTGKSEEENNCLSFIASASGQLYLGTEAGLFASQDNGRIWNKFSGRIGNLSIYSMVADDLNEFIYAAAADGVYQIKHQAGARRIFVSQQVNSEGVDTDSGDILFDSESQQINYICIDTIKPHNIYLSTNQGIFTSETSGQNWSKFSDLGLVNKEIRFIAILPDSTFLTATKSGVFRYYNHKWQELSLGLTMQDIRFLNFDDQGNIYAAGDKGLFKTKEYQYIFYNSTSIINQPTIQQIQQAAIAYAEVINPEVIMAHRKLARFQAVLPELSLSYDKTISAYNSSQLSRFTVGPRDWSASLKWDFGDLIWSEQQRLIDSQVRLMVQLRQDILDEVTRLYFERQRLQLELASSELNSAQRQEKNLKIKEFTALLDGLTGGYMSRGL